MQSGAQGVSRMGREMMDDVVQYPGNWLPIPKYQYHVRFGHELMMEPKAIREAGEQNIATTSGGARQH